VTVEYDPFDPETRRNPHPVYARLRDEAPVSACPAHGFYVVAKDEDIRQMLRDVATWSSRFGPGLNRAPENSGALVGVDPPEHDFQRALIGAVFGPRAIAGYEEEITTLARSLVDELLPQGSADLVPTFAERIPLVVICRLLGFDDAPLDTFRRFTHVATLGVMNEADPQVLAPLHQAVFAYFRSEIDRRRQMNERGETPPDDLTTRLLVTEIDGRRLSEDVLLGFMSFLLIGGSGTTTMLIGNVVHHLITHRELWEQVRADRSLVEVAIEESLRYDAPVHGLFRTPTHDVELHGVTIPEDTKTLVLYASANRDPDVWDDPDEFRLDRHKKKLARHLAFGYGRHICLGAHLSRMEARIALNVLLDRMPDLHLAGEPVDTEPSVLKGYDHLPVAW
jgi:cytochrome P450